MPTKTAFKISLVTILGLMCASYPADVSAHFLFIRIGEHAEAGRAAELFFSERAEAGDPRFVSKIAGTKLRWQHEPGKFAPLKTRQAADRLRAFLPTDGAVSVTGSCEYGILEREVPFLLRYYPKSISGQITEVNQFKADDTLPLEITATVHLESITLTLLDRGKPVPNATFTTVDDSLANEELTADNEGHVRWKPPSHGNYCIYSKVVRREAGERAGKKFSEIREFPTLTFQWPLGRTDGDQAAVELFEKAIAARANWHKFPGFSASIDGDYDGRPFTGTVRVDKAGAVTVKIDQDVAVDWVEDQLKSIVMHRMESPRRTTPILRFADQDAKHPLGRLLTFEGGRFASSYRVKEDQLMVVNRNMGSENMTITILENKKTSEGKFLPHLYTVQYWDASDGTLLRAETFENRWQKIGNLDLPTVDTVIASSASGLSVRTIRLSKHELLTVN